MSEWTADSNQALHLCLVRAKEDKEALVGDDSKLAEVFHPKFTYPIFGEEEKIYGYSDLKIQLHMASGSLRQFLSVKYSAKLTGDTTDDPEKTLFNFIPTDYIKSEETFLKQVEKDATKFKPMGEKIYSYVRRAGGKGKGKAGVPDTIDENDENAVVYEAYHANWDTPGFLEYHRRMQLFILLYIEAGSYIQEEEDKWEFILLFEKRRRKDGTQVYSFVGYSSLYPFYFYPESTRLRLSQFVIAGPYQKQGHGASLYAAIYDFVLKSARYAELTVEDPSEDFEDLRDKVDLRMLIAHPKFSKQAYAGKAVLTVTPKKTKEQKGDKKDDEVKVPTPKLGPPVNSKWAERWRKELKLAKRQYERLIEMLILRALDPSDEAAQRAFRLQVKGRLKRFNFEILMQMEQDEQYDKLDETFQSVKEGYERILAMLK